jgi:RNA polymerase sigma-70 factor (sigma-E family)
VAAHRGGGILTSERDDEFTAFVAGRQARLRRVAYAVCGDWDRAEDLLQTALTKLYVAWPRVCRDGREDAYVRQIIVRTNLDEVRRPWWRRERAGLDGIDPPAPAPDLDARGDLFAALQSLPRMQRSVVVLRYWLGLSVAETAADLRISEGTVKSHAHRGLERLRSEFVIQDP